MDTQNGLKRSICKNCGSPLNINDAVNGVVRCEYCGSVFTVEKSADPQVRSFIAMGEHDLDTCKFDEAYDAFRKAADLDGAEPEAYFGMALAAAKVQYIHDLVDTGEKRLQPICHDINSKKFVDDKNYIRTLELATPEQAEVYRRRADEIDGIKKKFFDIKATGLEYDCFICVKVTDEEDGKKIHTEDSHMADDLYHELKQHGYKPFYSEREIKNRTGIDYEAFILYALYMSGSMVLVCSDEKYLQTPWVKNEYTRFIEMIDDDRKSADSITIAFKGDPIERLPGVSGRIQGVNMAQGDAYMRIFEFVDRHINTNVPELNRKEYAGNNYKKKTAIRQSIAKRNLGSVGSKTEITVSDRSTLQNATGLLECGDYNAAIKFADLLIRNNPSNALAYRLRFLAENKCRTEAEYIAMPTATVSFDSLERSIASSDSDEYTASLYDLVYEHIMRTSELAAYREYIELPGSSDAAIESVTMHLFDGALKNRDCEVFDTVIKTVSDTDRFIAMNCEFARALGSETPAAAKYWREVLKADEGHSEALWYAFLSENGIKDVFSYFSNKDNFEKTEKGLFEFGYNQVAADILFPLCTDGFGKDLDGACRLADFLLSMIPKKKDAEYKVRLTDCKDALMLLGKPSAAKRYNDRLIAADKMNDRAHFDACLINHGFHNPLSVVRLGADLLDDPEFRAAFDIYPEKHPDKPNPYMEVYTFVSGNADLAAVDPAFAAAEKQVYVPYDGLKNCRADVVRFYRETADAIYKAGLNRYKCKDMHELFLLTTDVSRDPEWRRGYDFALAYEYCSFDKSGFSLVPDPFGSGRQTLHKGASKEGKKYTCGTCNGTGKEDVKCNTCGGTGKITVKGECPDCHGSGKVTDKCWNCGGDGRKKTRCIYCDGSGKTGYVKSNQSLTDRLTGNIYESCSWCHGTGKRDDGVCNICNGSGKGSTHTCNTCGGDGRNKRTCDTCTGTGKVPASCHTCHGEGMIFEDSGSLTYIFEQIILHQAAASAQNVVNAAATRQREADDAIREKRQMTMHKVKQATKITMLAIPMVLALVVIILSIVQLSKSQQDSFLGISSIALYKNTYGLSVLLMIFSAIFFIISAIFFIKYVDSKIKRVYKKRSTIISILISVVILVFEMPFLIYSGHTYSQYGDSEKINTTSGVIIRDGEWLYYLDDVDGGYSLVGMYLYGTSSPDELIIPEKLNDKTIVSVGENAFDNNGGFKSITLPKTIKRIEDYAIYEVSRKVVVYLSAGIEYIGHSSILVNKIYFDGTGDQWGKIEKELDWAGAVSFGGSGVMCRIYCADGTEWAV